MPKKGYKQTEEHRTKRSLSMKGEKALSAARLRGERLRGKQRTRETRALMIVGRLHLENPRAHHLALAIVRAEDYIKRLRCKLSRFTCTSST